MMLTIRKTTETEATISMRDQSFTNPTYPEQEAIYGKDVSS